jgi:hypothetical protein
MLRATTGAAGNGRPFSLSHVNIATAALADAPHNV